ncbi:hypothetical protein NW752_008543 [Fusarium irregulare]|uniref:Uncharacterized protein n=1 Tax=Fusarium irregulare TaxID=2494466 RepID=A0A9W8PWS1_9HYPO|nr:hypothetical protein NW752_008543 [Fusarium irregulare]KAJ4020471.1 hypothetical protein NW766_001958 [Fusarium irregulare]
MDEICKRFLITGRETLERLEQRLHTTEDELNTSRADHELIDRVGVLPKKGRYLELEALRNLGKGLLSPFISADNTELLIHIPATMTASRRGSRGNSGRRSEGFSTKEQVTPPTTSESRS